MGIRKGVIILRGLPGAGKTHFVRQLSAHRILVPGQAVICSADAHFERSGKYTFYFEELPVAHAKCLRAFTDALADDVTRWIVVDNTNISRDELAPYIALAQARQNLDEGETEVFVLRLEVDVETSIARNTHGVPGHVIASRHADWQNLHPYWPRERVIRAGVPQAEVEVQMVETISILKEWEAMA